MPLLFLGRVLKVVEEYQRLNEYEKDEFLKIIRALGKVKFNLERPCWACFDDDMIQVLFWQGFSVEQCLRLAPKIRDLVKHELKEASES